MADSDYVILVDEKDQELGVEQKLKAHELGLLHRAFSIMLWRKNEADEIELLLQQRASSKYHCANLWSNTCCSHPRQGESLLQAAKRRLQEEIGIAADLKIIGSFVYKAMLDNNLTEHEFDHVLIGEFTGTIKDINPEEVQDFRWLTIAGLEKEISLTPVKFTPWLTKVLQIVKLYKWP